MGDYIAKIDEFYAKTPLDVDGLAGRAPRRERLREILGTSGAPGSYQTDDLKVAQPPVISGETGGVGSGTITGQLVVVSGASTATQVVTLVTA